MRVDVLASPFDEHHKRARNAACLALSELGYAWDGEKWEPRDPDSARLSAAAPELLEALRDMVSDRDDLSDATVAFARAAIAKATTGASA